MKTRRLGANGPVVSAIGMGKGSSTTNFGERDDDIQVETTIRALDLGVTFLDSAERYLGGRHETLVARAVKGRRDRVVIASKFGNINQPDGSKFYGGRPEYVRAACERSLQRLGTDYIDLYYQHRIDPDVPIEETVGAMADLVRAGKVRWLGLCEAGPNTLERACRVHPITALQTEYSLWYRGVEAEILPACRRLGIGFVPYSPLGRGFLAGRIRSLADIAPNDIRYNQPRLQPGHIEKNLELMKPLEAIAARLGATTAQVALAWLLAQGEDIVPIPGTKQQKYMDQNAAATELELSGTDLTTLNDVFRVGAASGERYKPGLFKTLGA